VRGDFADLGPADVWFRLRAAIVEGQEPTPLQRVLAAADFGNGVSHVLDFRSHLFINADLTVNLERTALGEWIGLAAVTHPGPAGAGLAESRLYDETGPLGRATQSLLLAER
jgi:hypothetical protein